MSKDHVIVIRNKWTGSAYVHPTLFTKDEAVKWAESQDHTNSIYSIYELL